ncbi:hypothetical protein E6O75_ATG07569 [Venturia nashicola]|uniref:Uncharacterized protein n=1 Tax=Venturia nashicola TaxID=86259 RepID=A0A4Z1NY47_9PEZI|nr:hypothetical protein E6O75_ATG07569 [Venturia nashicola]
MRLPAMLLVLFSLLLFSLASPVPSIALENGNTSNVSIASVSDDIVAAKLDIEFCWIPEAHKDCQVLAQDNQRCTSQHYLNGIKSVHMTDQQFCMFFSDGACKGTGDIMIVGNTDDVRVVGLTFDIQSSFCYDLNLGNLVFSKRSIDDIEPAISSHSEDATDASNLIDSLRDEHLVNRFPHHMNSRHVAPPPPGRVDPRDTDVPTLDITMCYDDDDTCNAEPMKTE